MSAEDKPDATVGKASEPSTGDSDARATPGSAGQSREETIQPAPGKPGLSTAWRNRSPAHGLALAIPAGAILWAVVIYLFAKLV